MKLFPTNIKILYVTNKVMLIQKLGVPDIQKIAYQKRHLFSASALLLYTVCVCVSSFTPEYSMLTTSAEWRRWWTCTIASIRYLHCSIKLLKICYSQSAFTKRVSQIWFWALHAFKERHIWRWPRHTYPPKILGMCCCIIHSLCSNCRYGLKHTFLMISWSWRIHCV